MLLNRADSALDVSFDFPFSGLKTRWNKLLARKLVCADANQLLYRPYITPKGMIVNKNSSWID